MIRLALALTVLLAPAFDAAAVTFSTTATQMCVGATGCGVNGQTIAGAVSIQFVPVSSVSVTGTPPSNVGLGQIVVSCVGGGTACGSVSLANLNVYINITQTVPSAGNGSLVGGVFSGSISGTAGNASVTWATPNAVKIGTISYSVVSNPVPLVPPSTASGTVTIVGLVADATPPVVQGSVSRKAHGAGSFDLPLAP